MLRIKFRYDSLNTHDLPIVGAAFHQWLPDGEGDAVRVDHDENTCVLFWFERRGYVNNGFIIYDEDRTEINADVLAHQGRVDGGPLRGEVRLKSVSDEEFDALRQDRVESLPYIRLGKRVLRILDPILGSFVDMLRVRYGQYWIKENSLEIATEICWMRF